MRTIKHPAICIVFFTALATAAVYKFLELRKLAYPEGMDSDRNGLVSLAEWSDFHLTFVDADKDGVVSLEEWTNYHVGSMDVSLKKWKSVHYSQMDIDRSGEIDIAEWVESHRIFPRFYGGYDEQGYIEEGSDTYYEREFQRVDCNEDSSMDWYEYSELRWNLRWCESGLRPERPWWR